MKSTFEKVLFWISLCTTYYQQLTAQSVLYQTHYVRNYCLRVSSTETQTNTYQNFEIFTHTAKRTSVQPP